MIAMATRSSTITAAVKNIRSSTGTPAAEQRDQRDGEGGIGGGRDRPSRGHATRGEVSHSEFAFDFQPHDQKEDREIASRPSLIHSRSGSWNIVPPAVHPTGSSQNTANAGPPGELLRNRASMIIVSNDRRYEGPWDESTLAEAMLGSLGHRVQTAALDFARWAPSTGLLLTKGHVPK